MAQQTNTIGRRKTSTARVYVQSGTGKILVNNKEFDQYFPLPSQRNVVKLPLTVTETDGQFDIKITVRGGGMSGQAGAIQLGLARALQEINEEAHDVLKANGLLTRDDRMVERKKYGQPKARKRFQFSKR